MPQSDEYYTVPVTFIDLYWVRKNEMLADGDEPSDTEFKGELFFNDSVYDHVCEACGEEMTSGYVDDDSGVAYCLKDVGDLLQKGHAKIVKREPCSVCGDRALDFKCVGCGR